MVEFAEPLEYAVLPPVGLAEVTNFVVAIEEVRSRLKHDEWQHFCKNNALLRQWVTLLSEEPYTRRALTKPRGYAGDAVMMDLAYNHPSCATTIAASSSTGQIINQIVIRADMSVSVRERVNFVANEITKAATMGRVKIGSFASGHGRELEKISDDCRENIEAFYAIDIDHLSLAALKEYYRDFIPIFPIQRNVFRLKISDIPPLDVAYSLGLFDYLAEKSACRLVRSMGGMVAPGGRLIIGNLADVARNIAYCEAVMDWWMITRSEAEMFALADHLPRRSSWKIDVIHRGCFSYLVADLGA